MSKSPNSDQEVMSWAQLWTYIKSDICTSEMKAWTLKNMNLVDCVKGAMPSVQFEILEYAPKELLNHPAISKIIDQEVADRLGIVKPPVERLPPTIIYEQFKRYAEEERNSK